MSISKQKRLASLSNNFVGKSLQKFLISNMAANKKRTWQEFQKMVGEKRGKNSTTKAKSKCPSSIMVQRMSSAPNRSNKYEPLDTRDFVDSTDYDELNIENIRDACKKVLRHATRILRHFAQRQRALVLSHRADIWEKVLLCPIHNGCLIKWKTI